MRKTKIIEIQDREQVLKIEIREMPAIQQWSWLMNAAHVVAKGIGQDVNSIGDIGDISKLFGNGTNVILTLLKANPDEAQVLLDRLMIYCRRITGNVKTSLTKDGDEDIIQDVKTLFEIYKEVLMVNFEDFFTEHLAKEKDQPLADTESKLSFEKPAAKKARQKR